MSKPPHEETAMRKPAPDDANPPIAGTLSGAAMQQRLQEIEQLARDALVERQRRPGGVRLSYRRNAEAAVRQLVRRERQCCAFLTFEIGVDEEHVRVDITAPPEAEGFLD